MRRPARTALVVATLSVLALLSSVTTAPEPETVAGVEAAAPTMTPETITETPEAEEETPKTAASRYAGIELTDDDVETLARLVWQEARGEPLEGQVAVVEVVLNRILSPSFPDTVDEVVYQRDPIQFSPAHLIPTTEAEEAQYLAVETALTATEAITDADVVYFSTSPQNERIFATIGNHVFCRE